MPISFKREGGEIPVELQDSPVENEKIEEFLFVSVKCKTDKGNYIDMIFEGAKNTGSTLTRISEEMRNLQVDEVTFPKGTKAELSKFNANLNFDFDVLTYRYMKEGG